MKIFIVEKRDDLLTANPLNERKIQRQYTNSSNTTEQDEFTSEELQEFAQAFKVRIFFTLLLKSKSLKFLVRFYCSIVLTATVNYFKFSA